MPAAGLLAVLDDIATVLDDVALLTKVAAKKTAGVLGDDLALNAEQVGGVRAERELPVVWAVAKGSLLNKAILVPAALGISGVAAWAVTPLLMVGGGYLCFEGVEKLFHELEHGKDEDEEQHAELLLAQLAQPNADLTAPDLVAIEREKVRGAIRTDFVLSAEIVVISLGTVADATFLTRVVVLSGVGVLMTAGVYGLVAAIVKLDDAGLYLARRGRAAGGSGRLLRGLGAFLLGLAPRLMKLLSVVGTAAMFLVGGSILMHGLHGVQHWVEQSTAKLPALPGLVLLTSSLIEMLIGAAAGALLLLIVSLAQRIRRGPGSA
jgi:predicted DNA repair protein MutK